MTTAEVDALADRLLARGACGMAQTPGFTFMLIDARGTAGQALPNGHAGPPMIDVATRPVEAIKHDGKNGYE
jgi:hypothetical protein